MPRSAAAMISSRVSPARFGQPGALEAGPQRLDRVALGGVTEQQLHHQPGPLPPSQARISLLRWAGSPSHTSVAFCRRGTGAASPGHRCGFRCCRRLAGGGRRAGHRRRGAVAQPGRHRRSRPVAVVADHWVRPRGAEVRRVTGNSEAPPSSQNTMAARGRLAFARILGPSPRPPSGRSPARCARWHGGRDAAAAVHAVAQRLPDVAGMAADPGEPLDHRGDTVRVQWSCRSRAPRAPCLSAWSIRCSYSSDSRGWARWGRRCAALLVRSLATGRASG
jgi:hypothetical protein